MGNFYEVRLSRIGVDIGATLKGRELTGLENLVLGNSPEARTALKNKVDPAGIAGTPDELVLFNVSPTVTESRSVDYVDQGLPGPTGLVIYKLTQNRRYSISAKFVSRTLSEAKKTFEYINLLRSWQVPNFANGGKSGPPPILRLNGYQNNFFNIPVVLSELTINFPNEVDYIEVPDLAMVPIIQTVEVNLIEAHGTRVKTEKGISVSDKKELRSKFESEFNLNDFKAGTLPGYS